LPRFFGVQSKACARKINHPLFKIRLAQRF
jgi:hypothetical protein